MAVRHTYFPILFRNYEERLVHLLFFIAVESVLFAQFVSLLQEVPLLHGHFHEIHKGLNIELAVVGQIEQIVLVQFLLLLAVLEDVGAGEVVGADGHCVVVGKQLGEVVAEVDKVLLFFGQNV